jgi:hypothetical protein
MLWVFRILSGLWLVTFGYILTIGEAGLEPVAALASRWSGMSWPFNRVVALIGGRSMVKKKSAAPGWAGRRD